MSTGTRKPQKDDTIEDLFWINSAITISVTWRQYKIISFFEEAFLVSNKFFTSLLIYPIIENSYRTPHQKEVKEENFFLADKTS